MTNEKGGRDDKRTEIHTQRLDNVTQDPSCPVFTDVG